MLLPLEVHKNYKIMLYGLLVVSILSISEYSSKNNYSTLSLEVSRSEALDLAETYLDNDNIILDDSWSVLSKFYSGEIDAEDRFIWQEIGKET